MKDEEELNMVQDMKDNQWCPQSLQEEAGGKAGR